MVDSPHAGQRSLIARPKTVLIWLKSFFTPLHSNAGHPKQANYLCAFCGESRRWRRLRCGLGIGDFEAGADEVPGGGELF